MTNLMVNPITEVIVNPTGFPEEQAQHYDVFYAESNEFASTYYKKTKAIEEDQDLSESGRRSRKIQALAALETYLDRKEAETVAGLQRHAERWATATDPQRLSRIPLGGGLSEADQNYARGVALDAIRAAQKEGPEHLRALLMAAARQGDRLTVSAVATLPPTIRAGIVNEELLQEVGVELFKQVEPEAYQRESAIAAYHRSVASAIRSIRTWSRKRAGIDI